MATSNLMHHIVVILKDPSSCLHPILFYFSYIVCLLVFVFLFFVVCFHIVHCVHAIYNFIPLYINLVIKSLNIVIQAMRAASNIEWILFSKISGNVKSENWFFYLKIDILHEYYIENFFIMYLRFDPT
jgi:hypothetical protein